MLGSTDFQNKHGTAEAALPEIFKALEVVRELISAEY